jgi:GAF domain-containing protein/CheY-like chemotaxis protein
MISLVEPAPDPVLERIVEQASELLRAQKVGLAVIEPDMNLDAPWASNDFGPVLRFVAARGLSDQVALRIRPRHWRDGTTPMSIHERRPVWSEDVLHDPAIDLTPETRRAIEAEGYHAVLSVPLLVRDGALGALVLYRVEPGPFTPETVELAQVFATQAAHAIENARLYRRAEDRASKLHTLSALTRMIVSLTTSGEASHAVAVAATELLGARVARVWVDVPERKALRIEAAHGIDTDTIDALAVGAELPYGEGIASVVLTERAPMYGRDIQAEPRRSKRLLSFEPETLHAYAALPLVTGDTAVGVLIVLFPERRDFSVEERELMRLLADQAAIAIRQAQLYQEGVKRRQEAEVMAELASKINASLEPHEILERVVEGAKDLCRADSSRIAVRTPDDPEVRLRHAIGIRYPGLRQVVLKPGKGVGGRVLSTGRPFRTDDYTRDTRFTTDYLREAQAEGIVADLAVPIRSQDEIHGVLYVSNRSARPFTDNDEAILRRLAEYAGAAIANANLYQGLRTAHEQLAQSQATLVQNERLRALGEMAAGVAHDFNNMLAVIVGRAELLLGKTDNAYVLRGLKEIHRAATSGASTVRRIQNFTGTRRARPVGRVVLGQVVREVVQLTRVRWKDDAQRRGVPYDVTVEGDAPAIAGQSDDLREVFTNLLNNALDAMPDGGRCTFRISATDRFAMVEVEDNGRGMAPDVSARIFEPFFTTKGPRGSGLGLSVSWGIVISCGGTIDVKSRPGAGTRVTVRLPIPEALPTDTPPATRPEPAAAARILVIDDEAAVREVLSDLLAEAGHQVTQAASGPQGLALCDEERFDLVVTDLSMPGMSGWDVAEAVERTHPGVPIGLVTGWGEQVDPEQAARHRLKFVLAKPFVLDDVMTAVSSALP